MNLIGLVLIVTGVIFLSHSIIFKNKINYNNISDNLIIVNKGKFLKLQLCISILNSLCILIFGLIVTIYNLRSPYIILTPILFTNKFYLVRLIGRIKQYIKYK